MLDLIERLRLDAGKRTLGELIQDREAAAAEIERLTREMALLRPRHGAQHRSARTETRPDTTVDLQTRALLRLVDVCKLVGLSRSSLYVRMRDGSFPGPVRLSERTVRWRASDLGTWIAERQPASSQSDIKLLGRRAKT